MKRKIAMAAIGLWLAAASTGAVDVFVSILPQKYFVEKIGGSQVTVSVMVTPGASPATYEPAPRQMAALASAEIYFSIGVPFEHVWLPKLSAANANLRIVPTDHGIAKREIETFHSILQGAGDGAQEHGHDHHEHAHESGMDPHIWLSPSLVKLQAAVICSALAELDPPHAGLYQANLAAFNLQLDDLDMELRAVFDGLPEPRSFMVFHPSWGYFADTYGLKQIPVELEGKEPKPAHLAALIQMARQRGIRVIFVQPQFSSRSAQVIAREIGGRVSSADPLAEAWADNLRRQAAAFREVLSHE
ncbi:zinc ABC transporter substrate-binding protein [bacterium]|nr:zinc ABC transporter substrate-binding protein [candidate division CSSED10-310 bacterium]